MALYCIGDIQGCDDALGRLLDTIGFSASRDTVYLLGDLVNRGPDSAAVLRRCMQQGDAIRCLLGNHDLHLLAAAHGARKPSRRDTLASVLDAPDRSALLEWLRHQPLARAHEHAGQTLLMVHAIEVSQELLDQAPANIRSMPLTGPTVLAVRPFRDANEEGAATIAALQGVALSARPDLWQAYDQARPRVLAAAKPLAELNQRLLRRKALFEPAQRRGRAQTAPSGAATP
eukprot:gene18452-26019_t